eukprot:403363710
MKGTQNNIGPGSYNSSTSLDKLEKKSPCSALMRKLIKTRTKDDYRNYIYVGSSLVLDPESASRNNSQSKMNKDSFRAQQNRSNQQFMNRRLILNSRGFTRNQQYNNHNFTANSEKRRTDSNIYNTLNPHHQIDNQSQSQTRDSTGNYFHQPLNTDLSDQINNEVLEVENIEGPQNLKYPGNSSLPQLNQTVSNFRSLNKTFDHRQNIQSQTLYSSRQNYFINNNQSLLDSSLDPIKERRAKISVNGSLVSQRQMRHKKGNSLSKAQHVTELNIQSNNQLQNFSSINVEHRNLGFAQNHNTSAQNANNSIHRSNNNDIFKNHQKQRYRKFIDRNFMMVMSGGQNSITKQKGQALSSSLQHVQSIYTPRIKVQNK